MTDAYAVAEMARRQANGVLFGKIAEVIDRRATVEFEDGWISAPLPWLERRAGRVRTSSAPTQGEQVIVLSPGGVTEAGLILAGVPSDAAQASDCRDGLDLVETEAGYSDAWDDDAKRRTIALPEGGELVVTLAGTEALFVGPDRVALTLGGASVVIEDGEVTLNGKVNLGGKGGQPVARVNDAVNTDLKRIAAGSSDVKAV